MIRSEVYIGPTGPRAPSSTVYHPHYRERAPATPRFSDDGPREFDPKVGCWVAVLPVNDPVAVPAASSAVPVSDGSGVRWEVRTNDQQLLWSFEAFDFAAALAEKRRLCQVVGGRSGWAYLTRL